MNIIIIVIRIIILLFNFKNNNIFHDAFKKDESKHQKNKINYYKILFYNQFNLKFYYFIKKC